MRSHEVLSKINAALAEAGAAGWKFKIDQRAEIEEDDPLDGFNRHRKTGRHFVYIELHEPKTGEVGL